MRGTIITLCILLALVGCGDSEPETEYTLTHFTKEQMSICKDCMGFAFTFSNNNSCHIFIMWPWEYPDNDEYLDTIYHEQKHCMFGAWHPKVDSN